MGIPSETGVGCEGLVLVSLEVQFADAQHPSMDILELGKPLPRPNRCCLLRDYSMYSSLPVLP